MIGNDIVDLADTDSFVGGLHPRYLDRVFSLGERSVILASTDLGVALWAHWAAKESAFKAVNRVDPSIRFTPSSFETSLNESFTEGCVTHRHLALTVELDRTRDWIHAVSHLSRTNERDTVYAVDRVPAAEDPSKSVRSLARRELARTFSCSPDRFEISHSRPPELFIDGGNSNVVLSLSHHGRWAAYAALSSDA